MLEVFRARLKAKSTAAGAQNLSNARLDAMSAKLNAKFPDVTDEAEHDAKIDDLYDAEMFKDFAAMDDFQKAQAARKKAQPEKKAEPEKQQQQDDDMPAWAKTLIDQNKALSERLQGFEKEKTAGSIKQQLAAKLKDVPANYYENWQLPENEDQLEAFAEKVNTGYSAFTQQLTEKGLIAPGIPASGTPAISTASKKIDPAIAGFVKAKQAVAQQTK